MITFLLISQFLLSIVITVAVLLQKSSSIGLGAYSGSNESLFGAKGPDGFLAKFTAIVAILFVFNALTLGHFYQKDSKRSILDSFSVEQVVPKDSESNKNVPQIPNNK